jgi:trigger factor
MERKIERKENLEVVVTCKASGEEWTKLVKKEFNKRAAKVTVPGFRPGKAPANLVKARISQAEVLNDALFNIANAALKETTEQDNVQIFSEPKIVSVETINENEVAFALGFCLPPVVTLGQYKDLGVALEEVKASTKEVNAYINDLKAKQAVMQIKEGEAVKGDTVIIDFEGFLGDEAFEGGSANGYELELGSNSFVPGFEDQLVGMKAGEHRSILVKFPENYVEQLKGKEARFEVTCQDVKEKVLPELDEEFFTELKIEGVTDEKTLKAHAKKQVLASKTQQAKNAQLEKIINTAVENSTVEIPSSMINEEANAMFESVKKQVEDAGLSYDDYVAVNGKTEEQLDAERKAEATKNLKAMLVVENIIAKENLEVTREKLEEEYKAIAAQYNMELEQVKNALKSNEATFVNQLRNKNFTEFMLANNAAKVEETSEEAQPAKKTTRKTTKKEEVAE